MSPTTPSDLLQQVADNLPNNSAHAITAQKLRIVFNAIINSVFFPLSTDTLSVDHLFPEFVDTDHPYAVGDGFRYQLPDEDVPSLFLVRTVQNTNANQLPTSVLTNPTESPYQRLTGAPAAATLQQLAQADMVALLDGENGGVTEGMMYYVHNGGGTGSDVLVRGLGAGQVEPRGYARPTPTLAAPAPLLYPAHIDVRAPYAEPTVFEEITQANLIVRFATHPPLRDKIYRIIRPGGGVVEARFDNVSGTTPAAGTIVSETAVIPGSVGFGRYDLVADTFSNSVASLQSQLVSGISAVGILQTQVDSGTITLAAHTTTLAQKADKVQTNSAPVSSTNKIAFVRDTVFNPQTTTWLNSDFDFTGAVPGMTAVAEYNGPTAPGLPTGSRVLFGVFIANSINLYHYTYLSASRVLVTITH